MGDWHPVPLGEDTGEVTERLKMAAEGRLVWRLGVQVPVAGPSGLLNRLVRLGVLVGVGVSTGDESFGVCGAIPAFLAEKVGLGAWTPDLGEDTRSGEKADEGELVLGSTQAGPGGYCAPPVGLRGSCGDIRWTLK